MPSIRQKDSIEGWSAVISPVETQIATFGGELRKGLEQGLQGRHLRAARGLLGWSMMDLARASRLSLSTMRRLEDDAEVSGSRSRHLAVSALRAAGIRFSLLDDSMIAIARSWRALAPKGYRLEERGRIKTSAWSIFRGRGCRSRERKCGSINEIDHFP
ncbi:hypothetical protein [Methylobacterium dankookense]|uniref:hypothetical protein n=1 Tax=Methylobacterium dankookense TaxID=560405 RepID=UPI0011A24C39|nr:hypothetical protein [Methylobacterium dankookense]